MRWEGERRPPLPLPSFHLPLHGPFEVWQTHLTKKDKCSPISSTTHVTHTLVQAVRCVDSLQQRVTRSTLILKKIAANLGNPYCLVLNYFVYYWYGKLVKLDFIASRSLVFSSAL